MTKKVWLTQIPKKNKAQRPHQNCKVKNCNVQKEILKKNVSIKWNKEIKSPNNVVAQSNIGIDM